jgi:hypothetical protein
MMNRISVLMAAVLSLVLFPNGVGADITYGATICARRLSTTNLVYGPYGEVGHYYTFEDGYLACGIPRVTAADTNDDLWVYYNDINAVSGLNVSCSVLTCETANPSSCIYSVTRFGSTTPGGQATNPGVFAASGYLYFGNLDQSFATGTMTTVACRLPLANSSSSGSTLGPFYMNED